MSAQFSDGEPTAAMENSGRCRLMAGDRVLAEWASPDVLARQYWVTYRGSRRVWPQWRFVRELTHSGNAGVMTVLMALLEHAQSDDELVHVGTGHLQDLLCVDGCGARVIAEVERHAAERPRFRAALGAVSLLDDDDVVFDVPFEVRLRLAALGVRRGAESITTEPRVMHPSRATFGELDWVPVERWPMLAADWLADGFDSEPLRALAGLGRSDTSDARELMPEVLASLGYPLIEEAEFAKRCQGALSIVQRDLDATGHGRYRMQPRNLLVGGTSLAMWAALPNGHTSSGTGDGMTPRMNDTTLLWHAAALVSDTLTEIAHVSWPTCPQHAGPPMRPPHLYQAPHGLIDGAVWWWCRKDGGHAVAPVGQLTSDTRR